MKINAGLTTKQQTTQRFTRKATTGLMLALLCLPGLPQWAQANTIYVTSNADDGAGTLRYTLAGATKGDTIDATTVSGAIVLTSGELRVTKNVTILGPGAASLAVDGNATYRVFHIYPGITAAIAGLTITNGAATGDDGGGILNDHAILTMHSCAISGNFSDSSGGGIYNGGGSSGSATLTVINCIFSDNRGFFGGAINSCGVQGSATLAMSGTTFIRNSSSAIVNNGADGSATLAMSGGGFYENSTPYRGGGIYSRGWSAGNAIVTVSNATFFANSADLGGGIFNDAETGSATLAVFASQFSQNVAGDRGGGIFNNGYNGSATLTVIGSSFTLNVADPEVGNGGGAIFNNGGGSGKAVLAVGNCEIGVNSAFFGAGIYNDGANGSATLTVSNSTFHSNVAKTEGGGIFSDGFNGSAVVTVSASTFSSNSAGFGGGGIFSDGYVGRAALTVNACTFSGNTTDRNTGRGGILNGNDSALEIGDTILNAGASDGTLTNIFGTVTSHGFNLSSDDAGGSLTNATDLIKTDPQLDPAGLQFNGGNGYTIALLATSPAIDKGKRNIFPALASDTDQRGFPRPLDDPTVPNAAGGDGSDIGAFEVQNHRPIAVCTNVTVIAGAGCAAYASIDGGSFDPDGDAITLSQSPPGPYSVGTTNVTLTVTDSHGATNSCTAKVTVLPIADLLISKAVVSGQAKPGQVLIYTIIVNNLGPCEAGGVAMTDPVPQGTTFYAVSTTQGTYSAPPVGAAGTVTVNLGTLASGGSATITLQVKVGTRGNDLIVNTATVSSSSLEQNPANNSATITTKRKAK